MELTQSRQFDRNRYGGLYDRGRADAWYARPSDPHWYPEGTYCGEKVTNLSEKEKAEYMAGYNENHYGGKDWGEI
jgi:hypothetical protein